jgi:anti-sigma regulatory factor (Ser/Thr protein kinase)
MVQVVAYPIEILSIRSAPDEVRIASEWLEKSCLERDVPSSEINRLDLCLNEALANVISHGGKSSLSSTIGLQLEVSHTPDFSEASLIISDPGTAFDPFDTPAKSLPKTLAEAEPGGLGLLMMRNFSDSMSYRYSDGKNQLTVRVRWTNTQ